MGKTNLVRELAKSFDSSLELNFLERPELCSLFNSGSLSPAPILQKIQALFGISLTPGKQGLNSFTHISVREALLRDIIRL